MEHSTIQLNDLPDEIILIIFKQLFNIEVLYSFIGINNRLNTIAHDSIFTTHLTLMRRFSDDSIYPLLDPMLDKFFLKILPSIHHKIKWLTLESSSMERILLATHYPNLYGLGIHNICIEKTLSLFTKESSLTHIYKNQISSLVVNIINYEKLSPTIDASKLIFKNIFTMFTNLRYLNLRLFSTDYYRLPLGALPSTVISSSLLKLNVCVENLNDCLYLLDGRFSNLHTLYVHVSQIDPSSLTISNKDELPNLIYFSLQCDTVTYYYDDLILPLLRRMTNLENLNLNLFASQKKFIHGNDLKKNVVDHMSRLKKFTFSIFSSFRLRNQINLPSNEEIKQTINDLKNNHIIAYVDYFEKKQSGQYFFFSYPYKLTFYDGISNNFPGGLFESVRKISLFDEHPFEYEFFLRISQSFPFVRKLSLKNWKPQENKLCKRSNKDKEDLSVIKFHYLTNLTLYFAHDDYIEQFLDDSKTSLSNTLHVNVDFEPLKRVTYHFTRDTTRINCAKLDSLCLNCYGLPKYARNYFPHTKI